MNADSRQAELLLEIHEANLSYLMLARQMIKADRPAALFRLGVSQDVTNLLEDLSNSQLIKLASSNMMLARFRFDDSAILSMLTNHNKDTFQTVAHSAILMAGRPLSLSANTSA